MALDPSVQLRRFCILGDFQPVFAKRGSLNVAKLFPKVQSICKRMKAEEFLSVLVNVLAVGVLQRRDEAIFAYATYLATDVDAKCKQAVRMQFCYLLRSADDMFMFCKYSILIQKAMKLKHFSRTTKKAITQWYMSYKPEELREMWAFQRGAHGFTHQMLIKICRISDDIIGASNIFIETKTGTENAKGTEIQNTASSSLRRLRSTTNVTEALRIINNLGLRYNQVPTKLFKFPSVVEHLLPGMTYIQILKFWRTMAHYKHFKNEKILRIIRKAMNDKSLLSQSNIHPINFILQLKKLGQTTTKSEELYQINALQKWCDASFGENSKIGLKMHITLNLQTNYKKKFLKNQKTLNFLEASVATAFGYFSTEENVDVYYWEKNPLELKPIGWTKPLTFSDALAICNATTNDSNKQRLITPIISALREKKSYDIFLAIVPSAGRSNPRGCSDLLSKFLDKYRSTVNSNAKFIILDLLRFKKSMLYSTECNQNILEICGLDEYTTQLIANFGLNRIG